MSDAITSYRALALQTECHSVNAAASVEEARARIGASIDRIGVQLLASKGFIGPDLRLVVLPEYVLTGYPMGESPAEWIDKACLAPDGPEYDQLGKVAADADVWLCGNAYETDAHFEGLYFQTCFTIAPSGEC